MFLSGKAIDCVQETKYLGVILNSQLKTLVDVSRQTRKFYAQGTMLLRNIRYCSDDVKCMLFIILHQHVLLPSMVQLHI